MTSITLSYGATSLVLRPADFSDRREVRRVQARLRTHDGLLTVGDQHPTIVRFTLRWNALTDAERDEIEDFFGADKVNGTMNTFTYVDHFGVSNLVRLINDVLPHVNGFTNVWGVDMIFEVVADAGS